MAGFELLLQKQLKGKQMQKEMSEFIRKGESWALPAPGLVMAPTVVPEPGVSPTHPALH